MELLLNTVRLVDNDQAREYSIGTEISLTEKLAIAFINPVDFEKLNLDPDSNLKIMNKMGEIIVKVKKDEKVSQGTVLMPVSIWSNQITGVEKEQIQYKNLEVEVEATRDPVPEYKDLILKIKEK